MKPRVVNALSFGALVFSLLMLCGAAFQDPEVVQGFQWSYLWQSVLGGVIAAGLGYLKSRDWKFKWEGFLERAFFGLVVGVVAGVKGITLEAGELIAASGAIGMVAQEAWKLIRRHVIERWIKKVRPEK